MCISNPIPVIVCFGKCSNLITVSVKESFTLAKTVNINETCYKIHERITQSLLKHEKT